MNAIQAILNLNDYKVFYSEEELKTLIVGGI